MEHIHKTAIKITRQGVEIAIPTPRRDPGDPIRPFLFLMALTADGCVAMWSLLEHTWRASFWVSWVLGIGWFIGEIVAMLNVAATMRLRKEKILITPEGITIGTFVCGIGKATPYKNISIHHVRLAPQEHRKAGTLCFEYVPPPLPQRPRGFAVVKSWFFYPEMSRTICFGQNLDEVDAQRLLHHLADILRFHCDSVERIIFGTAHLTGDDPVTTLRNPDVSALTFPFVQLRHVVIQTSTYDFQQVERFVTYAVNVLSQKHLKKTVEVHIYGNPKRLHPNVRNTLTNLCKCLIVHEEQNMPLSRRA